MWYAETELYHFGVKGMKWGVRKRQANRDLRSAKKEYGKYSDKYGEAKENRDNVLRTIKNEKKEHKTYVNQQSRKVLDTNKLTEEKGKAYVNDVIIRGNAKRMGRKVASIAGTAAVAAGATYAVIYGVARYLENA